VKPIKNIVVVGGGSAGWMTASTLIKAFPDKNITVVESKDIATVGVGESTIGGIRTWTRFIGLDEQSFFASTDASYKLSIKFTDFYEKDGGGFQYPFGVPLIIDKNRNPFTDWHIKKYYYPETPVQDFSRCMFASSALYENNKFTDNKNGEFHNFDPSNDAAYHFDATKFGLWLKEKICLPNGVKHILGDVVDIKTNNEGIEHLILDNNDTLSADLYVDCTGWKSLLLGSALEEPFDSYADMLPNNSAWATRVQYKDRSKELEAYTNCTAIENGWCWNIPLWSRLGCGYVFSDKFVTEEEALDQFKKYLMSNKMVIPRSAEEVEQLEFKKIKMRVGIHKRTFVKNVVAIGLSAGFIEPLESNGLFSVHEFLFKLVDILQRGKISQFDRDMYNVSVRDLFDNFAKFVALHYALSHRDDSEYWRDIQNKLFSDSTGDPYVQYKSRADTFYNIIWRYMEEWGHPYGNAGIPYIATGMNLNMMNSARIDNMQKRYKLDLKKDVDPIVYKWEELKEYWNSVAETLPTLEEYLDRTFYHEKVVPNNLSQPSQAQDKKPNYISYTYK
jgi:hypothetical protein